MLETNLSLLNSKFEDITKPVPKISFTHFMSNLLVHRFSKKHFGH